MKKDDMYKNIRGMLKTRLPRKLKKAVAEILTAKRIKDDNWEISIRTHLKENTKWKRKANRLIRYNEGTHELYIPRKNGQIMCFHCAMK